MNYRVQVRESILSFYQRLDPKNRREVKNALVRLEKEAGDIRALREHLEGYYRLRVGPYRIIFRYLEGRIIECVYMNTRALVYDVFESELHRIAVEQSNRPKPRTH
jgi:mRNA-degrading endonuclease RelE of RelBE toxin-antitoxin system